MDKFLLFLFIIPSFCIEPPKAKKLPHQIQIHNKTWNDDFFWLNQKDDDWVLNYLNSENNYRDYILNRFKLFKNFYKILKVVIKIKYNYNIY